MPADYTRQHYVPKWYQYRFLENGQNEKKFYYLDLKPKTVTTDNGTKYQRNSLLRWGPPKCFYEDHLYTTRFPAWSSTEIEEKFFGAVDTTGKKTIDYFTEFTHPGVNENALNNFLPYMSIQRLRTPKGLSYLQAATGTEDRNRLLFKMQELQHMYCALWTECVWSIVDASNSPTKFILSDNPVTFYNQGCFPESRWCRGVNDPGTWLNGTHTIFPLSISKALVLTNLSWARNPYGNPIKKRPNSGLFRRVMFDFTSIQTGRLLSEQDVLAINYIIKKRASRYIAAANESWLYPEKSVEFKRWDEIGKSYLLMPDPRSMNYYGETLIGAGDRLVDAIDEYGRRPHQNDYSIEHRNQNEFNSFSAFQGEYARLFGPERKGNIFLPGGNRDGSVDSDDYHAYHLSLEQEYKPLIKSRRKSKKK